MGVGRTSGLPLTAYPRRSSPCRTLRRPRQRPRANRPTKFPRHPNRRSLNPSHPKPFGNRELKGALFGALVDAGADAMVAYNAEEGTKSMVSEAVATQVQPILVEMRQMFAAQERRFDALEQRFDALEQRFDAQERRFDALEQRFDALEQRFDALERKLDALTAEVQRVNEVVDVKLDGIRREMRLIWGALGISLTVWLVVLGYLLTN